MGQRRSRHKIVIFTFVKNNTNEIKKVFLLNFSTDLKRKVQIVNDDDDDSDQEDVKQKRKFNKKFRNKVIQFVKINFLFFRNALLKPIRSGISINVP